MVLIIRTIPTILEIPQTESSRSAVADVFVPVSVAQIAYFVVLVVGISTNKGNCTEESVVPDGFKLIFGVFFMVRQYVRHLE